jgi:elongation factor G
MASRSPDKIRNVVLVGQAGCGKTSLLEQVLLKTGAISRAGKVDDGSSVLDFDELEKERRHTLDPKVASFEKDGIHVNAIDTPGYRDFLGTVIGPMSAVEAAIVVVDADEGVRPHTRKLWSLAEQRKLPRLVVINRLDREHAKFDEVLEQLQKLSPKCVPLTIPNAAGPSLAAIEATFGPQKGKSAAAAEHASRFLECVVETNEGLLEKYLGGEDIPAADLEAQLAAAVRDCGVFPVLSTCVTKGLGIEDLVDTVVKYLPPASSKPGVKVFSHDKPDEEVELKVDPGGLLCGYVFRNVSDPFVGKLTWVRMYSGTIGTNGPFINPHTGKTEKVGKIIRTQGKEQSPLDSVAAGDIVAFLKVDALRVFDTISSADRRLKIAPPKLPTPMYGRALEPKTRTDEKKFSESLTKVTEEDPSVVAERDKRTHEMVVSGLSQLHLLTIINRLKMRYHVEVNSKEPKVPYLETITAKGDASYRHKKQSGGAGEFAEVWLKVEPLERGKHYEFSNDVFGGAIAESFVLSAEKGVKAVMEQGVIAGFPVVDIKVSVYDGKEHPVDSKDVAFQKAGREAFKLAVQQARPVLLEPIVNLEVTFPSEVMGDITGDLNRRRARVQGMDSHGDFQTIRATVPLSEVTEYSNNLGAMTGGQGTYEIEMSHYEVAPPNIQAKVVEEAKALLPAKREE